MSPAPSTSRTGSGVSGTEKTPPPSRAAPTTDDVPRRPSTIRTVLLNFSSQWFIIPQGAGITSLVVHQLDYQFPGQRIVAYVISSVTAIVLLLEVIIYTIRAIMYSKHVVAKLSQDPSEAAYFSSICIAFTSLVQMLALTLGHREDWGKAVCVLWWINMPLALAATIMVPYVFIVVCPPGVSAFTPVALLPLIAAITLAAGGGVVAQATGEVIEARAPIMLVSFLFLGIGMPLALLFSTIYMVRLFDRKPPVSEKVYQEMILCGPWGQGSFALQTLGNSVVKERSALAVYSHGLLFSEGASSIAGYQSMFLGVLSWAQGTFWWVLAMTSILHSHFSRRKRQSRAGIPYKLTEWAMVFPWGVYTNAAIQLGKLLDSPALRVLSAALAVVLVVILAVNMGLTARGLVNRSLLQTSSRKGINGGTNTPRPR